jgi:hypothetical protein
MIDSFYSFPSLVKLAANAEFSSAGANFRQKPAPFIKLWLVEEEVRICLYLGPLIAFFLINYNKY